MIVLIYYDILSILSFLLILVAGILLIIITKYTHLPIISHVLNYLERTEYRTSFPGRGIFFFLSGVFITTILFPKTVSLAAIMILTFGDSVSAIVGITMGKTQNPLRLKSKKTLEGTIAGIIGATLAAAFFISFFHAAFASFVAMTLESLDLQKQSLFLDDNMIIPIASGFIIHSITFI